MAVHDTIGDYLTMIRNASLAGKPNVKAPFSKLRKGIAESLQKEGYIGNIEEVKDERGHPQILLKLKYDGEKPVITGLERFSKPGRRLYFKSNNIPRVLGGLGVNILTTSKGILTDNEARRQNIGGELICKVW